ncbi:MAG TPA: hypothetical protein VMZ30_18845, partial [Pyrinomonadaceae bacterium]|nr:hypothetical protein [Pyrinomonadaceae bacterium]
MFFGHILVNRCVPFDLKKYLDVFPDVCKAKFGRKFDCQKIEKDFSHLARGDRWLSARDVVKVFDEEATPFARYWPQPNERELDDALRKKHVMLGPLAKERHRLMQSLLPIFRSTGVASILLRFTHPEHFGIISSPVLHLLQVRGANTADLYLAYCEELQQWQKHSPAFGERWAESERSGKLDRVSSKIRKEREGLGRIQPR